MRIKDLIISKENWCKGDWGRNKYGVGVHFSDEEAVAWCLQGMVRKVYDYDNKLRAKIYAKIRKIIKPYHIVQYNDEIATFSEIRSIIEKLDI